MEKTISCSDVTKFTVDDDSLLIDCVSEFEILWKMSHPEFKNNLKKDKLWSGIGQKINKTGESCKKRWRSIRDHFMREKKDLSGTGKAAKRKKRATYWENLSFLNYAADERHGCTNIEEEDPKKNCTEEAKSDDTSFNFQDDLNNDHLDEDDVDVELSKSPASTPNNSFTNTRCIKKVKRNDPIINLLQQRQADKNKLVNCFEKVFVEEQKPPDNENDLFFKSMAAIVNKLPTQMQAIARNKVFAVVSDLELAYYSAPSTSHSSAGTGPNKVFSPSHVETSSSSYEPSDVSRQTSNSPNQYQWMDKFITLN